MGNDIRFIYFDLGNVILHFDNRLMCSQLADVAEVPVDVVQDFLKEDDHQMAMERGEISFDQVFERFCARVGKQLDKRAAVRAVSDIFTINAPIIPIIARLSEANMRMGILSNTNDVHWEFITDGRYGVLPEYFSVHALSFRIGSMKPDRHIYDVAADLAGVPPESIFFTDDRPENVDGAKKFGMDAVPFEDTLGLARALSSRHIRFNY